MTHLARGNTALSMSMTALSSLLALVLLPLNFAPHQRPQPGGFRLPRRAPSALQMDRGSILVSVVVLLGLPLLAGMLVGNLWPRLATRVMPWFKRFSLLAFVVFVGGAVAGNWRLFVDNLGLVFFIVVLHNASAIVLGWAMAKLARQRGANLRAMVIEISMHNSGLALGLIFAQFGGEPNMALVAAFWGTWHLVSGLLLVAFWRNRPLPVDEEPCHARPDHRRRRLHRPPVAGSAGCPASRLEPGGRGHPPAAGQRPGANVEEVQLDIARAEAVEACIAHWKPRAIVHLASVVTPPPGMSEATLHAIDVEGTRAVVAAAAAHGVEQLVVTSSGAAYGYYPENAEWIDEADRCAAMMPSPTPATSARWRSCWLQHASATRSCASCCARAPSSGGGWTTRSPRSSTNPR